MKNKEADMRDKKWKKLLKPFANLAYEMFKNIQKMEDEQLLALRIACDQPTSTNCWFCTYHATQLIKGEVDREISRRDFTDYKSLLCDNGVVRHKVKLGTQSKIDVSDELDRWIGELFHAVGVANKNHISYKIALENLKDAVTDDRFKSVSERRRKQVLEFLSVRDDSFAWAERSGTYTIGDPKV